MRFSSVLIVTIALSSVLQFLIILAVVLVQVSRGDALFLFVIVTQSIGNLLGIWVAVETRLAFRRLIGVVAVAALFMAGDFLCRLEGTITAFVIPILSQALVTCSLIGIAWALANPFGRFVIRKEDQTRARLATIVDTMVKHPAYNILCYVCRCRPSVAFAVLVASLAIAVVAVPRDLVAPFITSDGAVLCVAIATVAPSLVLSTLHRGHTIKNSVSIGAALSLSTLLISQIMEIDSRSIAIVLVPAFWASSVLVVVRTEGYYLTWVNRGSVPRRTDTEWERPGRVI